MREKLTEARKAYEVERRRLKSPEAKAALKEAVRLEGEVKDAQTKITHDLLASWDEAKAAWDKVSIMVSKRQEATGEDTESPNPAMGYTEFTTFFQWVAQSLEGFRLQATAMGWVPRK